MLTAAVSLPFASVVDDERGKKTHGILGRYGPQPKSFLRSSSVSCFWLFEFYLGYLLRYGSVCELCLCYKLWLGSLSCSFVECFLRPWHIMTFHLYVQ